MGCDVDYFTRPYRFAMYRRGCRKCQAPAIIQQSQRVRTTRLSRSPGKEGRLQKRHCLAGRGLHALPVKKGRRRRRSTGFGHEWRPGRRNSELSLYHVHHRTSIFLISSPRQDYTCVIQNLIPEEGDGDDSICGGPIVVPGLNIGLMYFVQLFYINLRLFPNATTSP